LLFRILIVLFNSVFDINIFVSDFVLDSYSSILFFDLLSVFGTSVSFLLSNVSAHMLAKRFAFSTFVWNTWLFWTSVLIVFCLFLFLWKLIRFQNGLLLVGLLPSLLINLIHFESSRADSSSLIIFLIKWYSVLIIFKFSIESLLCLFIWDFKNFRCLIRSNIYWGSSLHLLFGLYFGIFFSQDFNISFIINSLSCSIVNEFVFSICPFSRSEAKFIQFA
jgi:hypothetical protein